MDKNARRAWIFLIVGALYATPAAIAFIRQWTPDIFVKGPGVTKVTKLSDWYDGIKGTHADTEVYILEGEEPGGTIYVEGGIHPIEPAGQLAVDLLIENAKVKKGRLILIPEVNKSGFSATEPGQAYPEKFHIKTDWGQRVYRYGMRNTNPIDQWPDPDVYTNVATGQKLAGAECGNLNRCFPGSTNGRLTDRLAWAVIQLIKKEDITVAVDLHEAPPDRPLNMAITAHDRSMGMTAYVTTLLEAEGINIRMELSPRNLRGLSHREWGDFTNTYAVLFEGLNCLHGPLHGPVSEDLILYNKDEMYLWATAIGRTTYKLPKEGVSIDVRTARHVATIMAYATALNDLEDPSKGVVIEGMPTYEEMVTNGIGHYLLNPADYPDRVVQQ